jgi:hypothetical protein
MNRAFVLGNGRSRIGLDLHSLRTAGKIFGCNALYRDFAPDVLIATDSGIAGEIESTGYPEHHEFFTRNPLHPCSKPITKNRGYSSGPVAATYAAAEGFPTIYLIGFDLAGIDSKHNNVYSGTNNYKSVDSDATYYGNWVDQIFNIAREYDMQRFVRIGTDNQYCPEKWQRHNIQFQTIDEFLAEVNTVSWQKQKE